jgi:hypothetical protein
VYFRYFKYGSLGFGIKSFGIKQQSLLGRNRLDHSSSSDLHFRGEHIPFFIRPKLKITSKDIDENIDKRWGSLTEYRTTYSEDGTAVLPYWTLPLRHFINITVENDGKDRAIECEIISRLLNKNLGCKWLDSKEKNLSWDNGETKKTIAANGGKAIFHLAFSQQNLIQTQKDQIGSAFCGIIKKETKVQSWIGTKNALQNPEYRDQDGLCQGEFKVHVEISTDYGHRTKNDFNVKVGGYWQSLDADMLECDCFKKSLLMRVLGKFKRRKITGLLPQVNLGTSGLI